MHDLRYKANILHRDVSVNNIMCDIQADGTPVFILNDFDLAKVVTEQGDSRGATSNHRTGTLPFMADDLVKDMGMNRNTESNLPHRLRHDFQSLFWSTLWCTARIEPVQDDALKAVIEEKTLCWEVGPLQTIGNNKTALLTQNADFDAFPITPKFARYRSYLDRWRIVFGAAVCELNIEMLRIRAGLKQGPLDASVLDRYTTRDMIKERLRGTSVMIEGGDNVSGSIGTQ